MRWAFAAASACAICVASSLAPARLSFSARALAFSRASPKTSSSAAEIIDAAIVGLMSKAPKPMRAMISSAEMAALASAEPSASAVVVWLTLAVSVARDACSAAAVALAPPPPSVFAWTVWLAVADATSSASAVCEAVAVAVALLDTVTLMVAVALPDSSTPRRQSPLWRSSASLQSSSGPQVWQVAGLEPAVPWWRPYE
mmetsp:Transcript_82518/g.218674  ORF Transcript_82518/g.218674 Transcript_82518/m.218674 type:complete len:200 (+) Transcript_82518:658-1257(+)